MIALLVALLYIGIMIHLANLEIIQHKPQTLLRAMVIGLVVLIGVWALNALVFVVISPEQVNDPELAEQIAQVDPATAILFIMLATGAMICMIFAMRSNQVCHWVAQLVSSTAHREKHIYMPNSSIHQIAVILMIFQTVAIVWTLMVSGGLDGLDFSYDNPLQALADVFIGGLVYVVVAVMGVGWIVRRDTQTMLRRLNLRIPTMKDWIWGIGMAILLYIMLLIATTIWALVVPPEIIEQQTVASSQLFEAFSGSLLLGLSLALITGISEEILFRGALQPVFGIFITSVFFTILHIQYALTPAILILFVVSLGFSYARQRASTSAAIIAHSTYNFIPFLLFTLTSNVGAV